MDSLLIVYIEAVAKILSRLQIKFSPNFLIVELTLEEQEAKKSIDERIKKIDSARRNRSVFRVVS